MPIAIITGASKGLGRALAAELADAGWSLIIDARSAEALNAAADHLRTGGATPSVQIEPIAGDITSSAHRDELIRAATARGRLDLLINNAGTLGPSPLPSGADLDPTALRDIVETNVVAPHALTRAALPLLRESCGIVVDITSDAAVEAYRGWGGYGAAKAATEQLRNVLAAEEPDVTVWRVDPGDLRTDMHQRAFPGEDISDRPLPETVAPGLSGLLATRPASGRYRLADYVTPSATVAGSTNSDDPAAESGTADSAAESHTAGSAVESQTAGPAVDSGEPGRHEGDAGPSTATSIAVVALVGDGDAGSAVAPSRLDETGPVALWLTIEVEDFAPAAAFYRDVLGLPEIDGWSSDGEVGTVFAVGPAARVEVERPETPSPGARLAIEYADVGALTAAHDRISAQIGAGTSPIRRHDRGHSGFTIHDPRGTELYLWSEK